MSGLSEEELFNCLANHIVGNWYHLNADEQLIFSLAEAPDTSTQVTIAREGVHYSGSYRLGFLPGWMAYLAIGYLLEYRERIIEMITKDTMVLKDKQARLIIYERRADEAVAENVIDSATHPTDEPR